jgi:DNA-binding beta-propeller fold protein YncE
MLCKDCEADDKNSLSAWAFGLSTLTFSPNPAYVMDVRRIDDLMEEKEIKFKPSAAAIHPLTGQLFIISSVNKVLVVADKNGTPEKVYKISPGLYKQPEGLTFSPEGHLVISNESANSGAANILVFKYNKGR